MTDHPKRIQISRQKGWRKPEGCVVVARPTKWGNPWKSGAPGGFWLPTFPFVTQGTLANPIDSTDAVALYRHLLVRGPTMDMGHLPLGLDHWGFTLMRKKLYNHADLILRNLHKLRGKDLACWCPLDAPCHADVLLELAND